MDPEARDGGRHAGIGVAGMMATEVQAAPTGAFTAGATDGFVIMSAWGNQANIDGNDTTITGTIGGGTWSVASTKPSFKGIWTAHDSTTFGPGTYTIDTVEGGIYTFTVGPGQVGGHILWDWDYAGTEVFDGQNIDVVNVWDLTGNTYTSRDWDEDGKGLYYCYGPSCIYPGETNVRGGEMIDGPFPGFNINFNFTVVPEPTSMALVGFSLVGLQKRKKR